MFTSALFACALGVVNFIRISLSDYSRRLNAYPLARMCKLREPSLLIFDEDAHNEAITRLDGEFSIA